MDSIPIYTCVDETITMNSICMLTDSAYEVYIHAEYNISKSDKYP